MLSRVFRSSTDAYVFGGFIDQLFPHCGGWPEPKPVLVIDNVSFYHPESDRADMCRCRGQIGLFTTLLVGVEPGRGVCCSPEGLRRLYITRPRRKRVKEGTCQMHVDRAFVHVLRQCRSLLP